MAIGKTNAQATAGKKTASGTFVGDDTATHNVSLDFTPEFVSCHLCSTDEASSTIGDCLRAITYEFTNAKGFISARFFNSDLQLNLGYSGNSSIRPSFSSGTLTLHKTSVYVFKNGYTYTWFAKEA